MSSKTSPTKPPIKRLFSLLLLGLLCTCGPAPQSATSPTLAVGSVRYQADVQQLDADMNLDPAGDYVPAIYGSAMPPFVAGGAGRFRARRTLPFPGNVSLSIPCPTDKGLCPVEFSFSPPFPDSIPPAISQGKNASFAALSTGLLEPESLVIFFEPDDRSSPSRISLQGPTQSGLVTIPKKALQDIPPGKYQVYLIKQRLYKDSTAMLQTSIQTEYFTKSVPVVVSQ